jgi:transcriptional regulator with XRE-family HTH domain
MLTLMTKTTEISAQQRLLELLRQIRLEAGLRQSDLADLLQQTQSFVSKYESGERRLDLLEIRQICQAVGISLPQFARRFESSLHATETEISETTQKVLGKRSHHQPASRLHRPSKR